MQRERTAGLGGGGGLAFSWVPGVEGTGGPRLGLDWSVHAKRVVGKHRAHRRWERGRLDHKDYTSDIPEEDTPETYTSL